jgi:hypothetical protein
VVRSTWYVVRKRLAELSPTSDALSRSECCQGLHTYHVKTYHVPPSSDLRDRSDGHARPEGRSVTKGGQQANDSPPMGSESFE